MKRYIRVFLLGILVMFGLINKAKAADRMYIVPVNSTDFTDIDQYLGDGVAHNTACAGDNYTGYPGHEGMNLVLDVGTPVYAAASGTVHRDDPGNDYKELCATVAENCYGYYMAIDHGNGNWTMYAHLNSYAVADGVYVEQGDLIAYSGNSGPTYPHLHWEVLTGVTSNPVSGHPNNPYYCDNEWFISDPPIYANQYAAIQAKADELWAIRPSGSGVSCEGQSSGLICQETENMHWWEGLSDPYIIETWTDGTQGEVDLTFDPDNTDQDRAYVVWGGFREMFHLDGHANEYGPPIGD